MCSILFTQSFVSQIRTHTYARTQACSFVRIHVQTHLLINTHTHTRRHCCDNYYSCSLLVSPLPNLSSSASLLSLSLHSLNHSVIVSSCQSPHSFRRCRFGCRLCRFKLSPEIALNDTCCARLFSILCRCAWFLWENVWIFLALLRFCTENVNTHQHISKVTQGNRFNYTKTQLQPHIE